MWTTKDGHVLTLPEPRLRAIAASLAPPSGPDDCPECNSRHIVADAASTARFIGTLRDRTTGQEFQVFRGHSGDQEVELITEVAGEEESEGEVEGEAGWWPGRRFGRGGRHRHWRRWRWGGMGGDDDGGGGDDQEVAYSRYYRPRGRILFARYPRWRRSYGRGYGYRPWYPPVPPIEPEPMPEWPPPPMGAAGPPGGAGGGGFARPRPDAGRAPPPRGQDEPGGSRGSGSGSGAGGGGGGRRRAATGTEDGLPAGAGSSSRSTSDSGTGRT